jgi:hypothetical protein
VGFSVAFHRLAGISCLGGWWPLPHVSGAVALRTHYLRENVAGQGVGVLNDLLRHTYTGLCVDAIRGGWMLKRRIIEESTGW